MYTTDYIVEETDSGVDRFIKPSKMSQLEFGNLFWIKPIKCPNIHENYVLKAIFVEQLLQCIINSVGSYQNNKKVLWYRRCHIMPSQWQGCQQQHDQRSSTTGIWTVKSKSNIGRWEPINNIWFLSSTWSWTSMSSDSNNLTQWTTRVEQRLTTIPKPRSTNSFWTVVTAHHSVRWAYSTPINHFVSIQLPHKYWSVSSGREFRAYRRYSDVSCYHTSWNMDAWVHHRWLIGSPHRSWERPQNGNKTRRHNPKKHMNWRPGSQSLRKHRSNPYQECLTWNKIYGQRNYKNIVRETQVCSPAFSARCETGSQENGWSEKGNVA